MEQWLNSHLFLAGVQFSIADIALYAYTHTAEDGGFDLSPWTAVRRWLRRVEAVPGFLTMEEACS